MGQTSKKKGRTTKPIYSNQNRKTIMVWWVHVNEQTVQIKILTYLQVKPQKLTQSQFYIFVCMSFINGNIKGEHVYPIKLLNLK